MSKEIKENNLKVSAQPAENSAKADKNASKKAKRNKTKSIQVPIRLEMKPDGRLVWDVAEVHRTLAKLTAKNPDFANAKSLVKKDAGAIDLSQLRSAKEKVVSPSTTEGPTASTTEIVEANGEGEK